MTRDEFLFGLEQRLHALPRDERVEALRYYREYFDEAGTEHEQDVIRELKSPAHVAAKILAEYSQKQTNLSAATRVKHGFRGIWFALLAIFAAPIAIPVAIAIGIVVILMVIVGVVVIFAFIVAGFALVVSAVLSIFVRPAFFVFAIGAVLVIYAVIRLMLLAFSKMIFVIQKFIQGL